MISQVWFAVGLSALGSLVFFLGSVRNVNLRHTSPYAGFCDLYLLEHMLPDGHPLGLMYKGIPRDERYPRLLWPCLSAIFNAVATIIFALLAAVLSANGILGDKAADTLFSLLCIGTIMASFFGSLLVPNVHNKICSKRMAKMKPEERILIHSEIEKKWPGFFSWWK